MPALENGHRKVSDPHLQLV